MPRLIKASIICGAVPLVVGTSIYIAWRVTQAEWLMGAGYVTIIIGLILFLAGGICLSLRSRVLSVTKEGVRPKILVLRRLAWLLLFANFPAASFFVWSAIDVTTRYTLLVVSKLDTAVNSFVVIGPGVRAELGPISAHAERTKHMHFSSEGRLSFEMRLGQKTTNGLIDDYVSQGLGKSTLVRINPDGTVEVSQVNP